MANTRPSTARLLMAILLVCACLALGLILACRPATTRAEAGVATAPTVVYLDAIADAYVDQCMPTVNYSHTTSLMVAFDYTEFVCDMQSVLRFDLSAIPKGADLDAATLRLHQQSAFSGSGTREMNIARSSESWSETTVNWNNRPDLLNDVVRVVVGTGAAWRQYDVTTLVVDWVEAGEPR